MAKGQETMTLVFIVNLQAGKGKCKKKWEAFYKAIKDEISPHQVYLTDGPGVAEKLTRVAICNRENGVVVAVGGDGTANEVLNGAAGSDVKIGILPFGTGNDLAKALGISTNLQVLIAQYKKQSFTIKQINVGKMNDRFFASSAGVGFDGIVADYANRRPLMKNMGKLGYLLSALKLAKGFVPTSFRVVIDGIPQNFPGAWLLAIGNGPYYGGGMEICPNADMEDDYLDLCVVHNLSKRRFFQLFPSVYKGTHIKEEQSVTLLRGLNIQIEGETEHIAHSDGEFIKAQTLSIELCEFKQTYLV